MMITNKLSQSIYALSLLYTFNVNGQTNTTTPSPTKSDSDDDSSTISDGELYIAIGLMCFIVLLMLFIIADICHKKWLMNARMDGTGARRRHRFA